MTKTVESFVNVIVVHTIFDIPVNCVLSERYDVYAFRTVLLSMSNVSNV